MKTFSMEQLKSIVCREAMAEESTVTAKTRLMDDLGIDSMGLVKIISEVSETYDVTFDDIDFDGVNTLAEAYEALCKSISVEIQAA